MKKKNWFLIVIILAAVLLIATVIWIYAKRIEHIESKMKISTISVRAKLLLHTGRRHAGNQLLLFGFESRQPDNAYIISSWK